MMLIIAALFMFFSDVRDYFSDYNYIPDWFDIFARDTIIIFFIILLILVRV